MSVVKRIGCRTCDNTDCNGCNVYILDSLLKGGVFDKFKVGGLIQPNAVADALASAKPINSDGKIKSATENELFSIYLDRGWDDIMDFHEFLARCEQNGTKIVAESGLSE